MYRQLFKHLLDFCATLILLVLLSPVLLLVTLMVLLKLGHPILFRQQRPGLNGKPFTILKFRTMTDGKDVDGNLLSDADRLSTFGRFLRSSSLDELPEFWNVLKGEMSLVGPRPLLMQYLPLYTAEQKRRHEVRPGITGWAQINGRNAISWEEKFKMDVWYVDNQTFWLDIKIILQTIVKTVKRDDINQQGYATIRPFQGTEL